MKIVKDGNISFVTMKSKEGQAEIAARKAAKEKAAKEREAKAKK